jgi:hypothetical protein
MPRLPHVVVSAEFLIAADARRGSIQQTARRAAGHYMPPSGFFSPKATIIYNFHHQYYLKHAHNVLL